MPRTSPARPRAARPALVLALIATALVTSLADSLTAQAAGASASISGTVTLTDGRPLAGGWVSAGPGLPGATVGDDGRYRIDGLAPGSYTLHFQLGSRLDELADYVPEYWNNRYLPSTAVFFDLAAGQHLTDMDAQLGLGATVSGRITLPGGTRPGDAVATVVGRDGGVVDFDYDEGALRPDGSYLIRGVPPGEWTLEFWGRSTEGERYVTEYWGDKPYVSQAAFVKMAAGANLSTMNAELARGASISGRMTDPDGKPVVGGNVYAESMQSLATGVQQGETLEVAQTDAEGRYTVEGLPPGFWSLQFNAPWASTYRTEFWSDRSVSNRDVIRVLPQTEITGKDAQLASTSPTTSWGEVTRVAGSDRYATAVAVSAAQFPAGVPVAYVASGVAFPDALAAAPVAAATRSPVLLTAPDALPAVVADELRRLKPGRIVVLGSPGAVSSTVAGRLREFTTGSVTRLAGADRYATAVAVSKSRYEPGIPVVYLASGATFPDALSGAPHAGLADGPILLTGATALPSVVVDELKRLRPEQVRVLGSAGVISSTVEAQLRQLGLYFVDRYAGPTRYETSAVLSGTFEPGVSVAYVANGANFPDALAAGPVAGITSGPVLLTPTDALPEAIAKELKRLRPARIVILGSPGAVSTTVETQIAALSQ
ncbi:MULTISPECIES: cell wall-binding repeat-containing protein [unclassified Agromyces]|uniref:cell wall-binding repeat-containing protein n=1 Tax=unclassified Agromyces TaxID=2639701 RepID=UPI003014F8D9